MVLEKDLIKNKKYALYTVLAVGFFAMALGRERGMCEASAADPTLAKNLPHNGTNVYEGCD